MKSLWVGWHKNGRHWTPRSEADSFGECLSRLKRAVPGATQATMMILLRNAHPQRLLTSKEANAGCVRDSTRKLVLERLRAGVRTIPEMVRVLGLKDKQIGCAVAALVKLGVVADTGKLRHVEGRRWPCRVWRLTE